MAPALNAEVIRAPTGPVLSEGAQQPSISETIVHLAEDPIPNIRFNVAKALEVLATVVGTQPGGQEVVKDTLVPAIRKLKDDSDADVRYFAGKALEVSGECATKRPSLFRSLLSTLAPPQIASPIADGHAAGSRTNTEDQEMTDA